MMTMSDQREQDWMVKGACRGAPAELFITAGDADDEPPYPLPEAKAYCDMCPVAAECLGWALKYGEQGVWGGTTSYQRRQLLRPRERTACPGCGSGNLVIESQAELCLSCGVSWTII